MDRKTDLDVDTWSSAPPLLSAEVLVTTGYRPLKHTLRDAGFVHGKKPAICPAGCKPVTDLLETPKQKLLREALEYQVSSS
jgi:hypothetical protein